MKNIEILKNAGWNIQNEDFEVGLSSITKISTDTSYGEKYVTYIISDGTWEGFITGIRAECLLYNPKDHAAFVMSENDEAGILYDPEIVAKSAEEIGRRYTALCAAIDEACK